MKKTRTTLIDRMKHVFPTRDELNKKLQQLPTRAQMHSAIKVEIGGLEERLNEKMRLLPTKDEFFTRMDELSGEIKAVRQEQIIHAGSHSDINDRFDRIDRRLGISTAS